MSLNLQQLNTFCTVIREGSMTAAAAKLYLTQPAISQQIRLLEQEAGAELLVRGVRSAKPTLQGQLLYEYAKRIIQLTQQAELAIQTVSEEVSGHLRIGTLNSLGMAIVSPLVGLFLKNNAALKLHLTYGAADEIITAYENKELDVLILPEIEKEYERAGPAGSSVFLFRDEMKLVGSGRDPHLPRQVRLSDLAAKPWVHSTDHPPRFLELCLQKISPRVSPIFSTNNVGTLKQVVEASLGWGFLPYHSVHKQLRMGRLINVEIESFHYSMNVMMYSTDKKELKPAIGVLLRALQHTRLRS